MCVAVYGALEGLKYQRIARWTRGGQALAALERSAIAAVMGWCAALPAQANDASLGAITVKGEALAASGAAFSTSHLSRQDIADSGAQEIEALWRQVPGMHVNHYQLSGVANSVVLRGFSGGGHGGDVAATLDGIPLNEAMSHADGYFDLNVVVPLEVEEVTVHRGPVSVLEGNYNRAGLVALQTRRAGVYTEAQVQAGSHGSHDLQGALGRQLGVDDQMFLAAQSFRTDGERTGAQARRHTLSGRWHHRVNGALDFALSARWHAATGHSPGYLTQAQWQADPWGKDPRVQGDGADKQFATLRLDVNYALSDTTRLLAFAYGTQQDFVRWFTRPRSGTWMQREERYDRSVQGLGLNLSGRRQWAGAPLEWLLGAGRVQEDTGYGYWEGLQQRQRRSPAVDDRRTALDTTAAYAQAHWKLAPWLQPGVAVRWDRFTGGCRLLGAETGSDPCGRMAATAHASPKLGLTSVLAPDVTARASWSEGFALASDFAKYDLGAAQVQPNVFRQTELGLQWAPHRSLWLDMAVYRTTSSQEIRSVAPGVYENFGGTLRSGAELHAVWTPHRAWELQWSYGRMRSRVTENANTALLGKQVTAVPAYTSTLQARWKPAAGWLLQAVWSHMGRSAIDAGNTTWNGSYQVGDVGAQVALPRGFAAALGGGSAQLSLWVRNVADQRYASSSSLIGGERLVAPGAPRTVTVGLKFTL